MTHYETLQVTNNASDEVIRMAYKALAKKYHPDTYQGDPKFAEEMMKQLNAAFAVLSDKQKRKQYDAFLHSQHDARKTNDHQDIGQRETYADAPKSKRGLFFVGIKKTRWIIGSLLFLLAVVAITLAAKSAFEGSNLFSDRDSGDKQEPYWLSEQDFFYDESSNQFVLLFELADKNHSAIATTGVVSIKIVNSDNTTVYRKTRSFSEPDFVDWIYDNTINKYLATIYINPNDITSGSSPNGKVYFTVYANNLTFDETALSVGDLPVDPVVVQLPSLPLTVDDYQFYSSVQTTLRIDSIVYEPAYEDSLYIYFAGEKIYDADGETNSSISSFEWKLYDIDGYLIDAGTFYTDDLSVGDKFKDEYVYISGIKFGESYRLVIVNAVEGESIENDSHYVGIRTISLADKQTAQMIVDTWSNGNATEDSMIALMDQYGAEQGGGQLYFIQTGEFVKEIDDWCFDRSREVGDVEIIKTDYGYAICYFSSIVEP